MKIYWFWLKQNLVLGLLPSADIASPKTIHQINDNPTLHPTIPQLFST